jgi:hypothetical protein
MNTVIQIPTKDLVNAFALRPFTGHLESRRDGAAFVTLESTNDDLTFPGEFLRFQLSACRLCSCTPDV